MKKVLIFISSILLASFFIIPTTVKADTIDDYSYVIYLDNTNKYMIYLYNPTPTVFAASSYDTYTEFNFRGYRRYAGGGFTSIDDAKNYAFSHMSNASYVAYESATSRFGYLAFYNNWTNSTNQPLPEPAPPTPPDPEPPEPESSSWLSDLWDWFLWQLGINDDYSGDIDEYITGGDRERMELVTPTPTPTPTPRPTLPPPTIVYPNGDSATISGLPDYTIINGGDTSNNYYGSDFDIFEVDLQIGDGGTSNPRDGINSVMDSSKEYLADIDISPVQHSFSLIPSDWFLLIGVLGAIPIIAGFISKLLK